MFHELKVFILNSLRILCFLCTVLLLQFVPKLQHLILESCQHLTSISRHIHAPLLEKVDLRNCDELLDFPSPGDRQSLKRLCELIIVGCEKLKLVPSNIHLKSLVSLNLSYSSHETIEDDTLVNF